MSAQGSNLDLTPIWISLKTASITIVIIFILGLLAAWWIYSRKSEALKMVFDGIFTLPMVLPPTVAGFFLLMIFGVNQPIGKFFMSAFGIRIAFSFSATVIAAVVISFPLMYRNARGAFDQVDTDLVYAARTLGMSEWNIFLKVLIPNALPGIISGGVLAFARGLGEFGATAMLAGNIIGKTRTLPVAVYSEVMSGDMESAAFYVWVIIGISFPRYSMRTLKALEFASNRKAKVITLTDSVHSPMTLYSSCNLIARSDMASIVDSLVAPLSVINALIVAICMKKQKEVVSTLETLEKIWGEYQVYSGEESSQEGGSAGTNESYRQNKGEE